VNRRYERLMDKWEKQDRQMLQSACEKLEASADLRYFLRWLLDMAGHGQAPPVTDPLTMAHKSGMMALASVLVSELNTHTPSLYPSLIIEANNERRDRSIAERDATDLDA
jgi:hypothetical protein